MNSNSIPHCAKATRFAALASAMIVASAACGAVLTPITPTVDHSKKATCGIKWTYNKNQAIKTFQIFRGVTEYFEDADCIAEVDNTTTRITDWGADQYQNYWYWVIPFDYEDESNVLDLDLTRYSCENHRYWGSSDVYLTAAVKTLAIGSTLPLYFKVNMGTSGDPLYDHVKPDSVRITKMTDLNGKDANDIAAILTNRDSGYALHEGEVEDNTYLKANGAFGYVMPNKPGILYIRAYYKSATTASPLRIEIKKPTFNLYAPEGEIDIVDNNYRDLFLKCNGKFICPDVECTVGDSVMIRTGAYFQIDDEPYDELYENSFGFLEMIYSDAPTLFDITFNGMLVKEYQVNPFWDTSRKLSFFYMDTSGRETTSFATGKNYFFGIKYGNTTIPHKISKFGWSWLTFDRDWGFIDGNVWGFSELYTFNLNASSQDGELGWFNGTEAGWAQMSVYVLDRQLTDSSIQFRNK